MPGVRQVDEFLAKMETHIGRPRLVGLLLRAVDCQMLIAYGLAHLPALLLAVAVVSVPLSRRRVVPDALWLVVLMNMDAAAFVAVARTDPVPRVMRTESLGGPANVAPVTILGLDGNREAQSQGARRLQSKHPGSP